MTKPETGAAALVEPRGVRLAQALGVREAGRVLRDFATYLPGQAVPALAGFLVLPVLARRLAPTELGVLALAQTLITLGWTFAASWLAQALIREYPAARARDDVAGFSATLVRGLGVSSLLFGAFAVLLALGGILSEAFADSFPLIIAATAGLILQNVAISLFAASLRPRAFAAVDAVARTGGIGLGVALVFAGHKVQGYLLGLALASLVVGAVGLAGSWPRSGGSPKGGVDLRTWLRYGIGASASGLALWTLFFLDRYMLAALKDTGAVGIYSVGNVIGDKSVTIPALAFFTGAAPLLVTAFERHGRAEVERLMRAYSRILLLMGLPTVAFVWVTAGELVPLLAGERYYSSAAAVVPIVAVGAFLYVLALVGNTGLVVAKRPLPLVYAALIAVAVNVVAGLVLIPPLGVDGAAIAKPFGTGAYLVSVYLWARGYATWRFPYPTLLRCGAAAGLAYGVALVAMPDGGSHLAALVIAAASVGGVYVLALALLGERRGFERRTLRPRP